MSLLDGKMAEPSDWDDDEFPCEECGAPCDDGEGWDGLCGACADRQSCEEE